MLSRRIDAPRAAMRPFDLARDGTVLGEGAGAIVLERRAHAEARGVSPLARIAAYDRCFCDPNSSEFSRAITRSIDTALRRGDCGPADLAFASANATSDRQWDAIEAQGIVEVLEDVPVWAPKSYFGNLGPGTSIVELIASITALRERTLPGTLNFETPDPDCPVNVAAAPESYPTAPPPSNSAKPPPAKSPP